MVKENEAPRPGVLVTPMSPAVGPHDAPGDVEPQPSSLGVPLPVLLEDVREMLGLDPRTGVLHDEPDQASRAPRPSSRTVMRPPWGVNLSAFPIRLPST